MLRYLRTQRLCELLDGLRETYAVYVPDEGSGARRFRWYDDKGSRAGLGEVRTVDPLKALFFRARECVAEGFSPGPPAEGDKPLCVVGAKACDLKGFEVQDHVFRTQEPRDPFYCRIRDNALIISADCTCSLETCFCTALDIEPHPTDNFDLNMSSVDEGYLVESGSEKGEETLSVYAALFEDPPEGAVEARDEQRGRVRAQVDGNLAEHEVPNARELDGAVEKHFEGALWADEADTCVECGACNTICPTCHCFLLHDQRTEGRMARMRVWDSCLLKDFARVAGGANPRDVLWMRLRNRFDKKFNYFPRVAGFHACTGCGRCISACPARIDIRRVMRRLTQDVQQRESIPAD